MRADYLRAIQSDGRPGPALTDRWLTADLDWDRMVDWLPDAARLFRATRVQLNVAAAAGQLKISAHLAVPESKPWQPLAWQSPTNLVGGPLDSFTAGRDVGAFLNQGSGFSNLVNNPLTNQFYAWAMNLMPFLSYMAWPAANASNALDRLSTNVPAAFNQDLQRMNGTEWTWQAKARRLVLSNLRVIYPTVEVAPGAAGDYLMLGFFSRPPPGGSVPDKLWSQIRGRTNLVYYDWDQTGLRLQQWRLLARMLMGRAYNGQSEDVVAAEQMADTWLAGLGGWVGETVTEITRPAPDELLLERNAPLGLTGIEWFALSEWIARAGEARAAVPLPPPGKAGLAPVVAP